MNLRHENVPDFENEVARAAIADRNLMRRAQPVEGRQAVAEQRDAEPLRHLPPVAVGHDQVAIRSALFEIFEVADQHLIRRPSDFDRDLMAFNTLAGTLDLRTGEMHAHNPADMLTMLAPVQYGQEGARELLERFLDEATGGDADYRRHLQKAIGYAMTGRTSEEAFFVLYGTTGTGKSTFAEMVRAAFGDYALAVSSDTFLARDHSRGASPEVANLAGRRFAEIAEQDRGKRMAEGLVKATASGDTMRARHLYQAEFEFRPTVKLFFHTNHVPG